MLLSHSWWSIVPHSQSISNAFDICHDSRSSGNRRPEGQQKLKSGIELKPGA